MNDNGHLAIDLHDVAKTYGRKVKALRGIEMRVHHGEVFGLLGPNGAGKSTLVKILMTVIRASRCSGTMLGKPVGHKATLARVGYLPEHHRFPGYLTGEQVLDYYAAMAGARRVQRRKRAGELLDLVGMTLLRELRVKGYSKGMRQRLGVANALVNDPDLVLLDEPTDGVDPVGRRDIREVLLRIKDQGKTVFLNSHLLSELELICDRVAILVQGEVSEQGTIDELTQEGRTYDVCVNDSDAKELRSCLSLTLNGGDTKLKSGEGLRITDGMIRVQTQDPEAMQQVIDQLRVKDKTIVSIRPKRPSLEDLFMRAVTDPETGRAKEPGADVGDKR